MKLFKVHTQIGFDRDLKYFEFWVLNVDDCEDTLKGKILNKLKHKFHTDYLSTLKITHIDIMADESELVSNWLIV